MKFFHSWAHVLAATPEAVLQLVLPRRCLACGHNLPHTAGALPASLSPPARPTHWLCRTCQVDWLVPPQAMPVVLPTLSAIPVWAGASYSGSVRLALQAHKNAHVPRRVAVLGQLLAHSVGAALQQIGNPTGLQRPPVVLVPAPSRPQVCRQRRGAPVAQVAQRAARVCRGNGMPMVAVRTSGWLVYQRTVVDQAGLTRRQRHANLNHALQVRRIPHWWHPRHPQVIIIDDIVTTGATVSELARALAAVGIPTSAVATIAATAPPG